MIQNRSKIKVCDNSGAIRVRCFKNLKFKNNNKLNLIVKVSVREVKINNKKTLIKKGQVYDAFVVKKTYTVPRFNGQKVLFDINSCILINKINFKNKKTRNKLAMLGSTVLGIALKEFRIYSVKLNINSANII